MFYYDYEKKEWVLPEVKVNPNMKDHSKDPFFVKKHEMAVEFLKRAGLPKWWNQDHGERNDMKEPDQKDEDAY